MDSAFLFQIANEVFGKVSSFWKGENDRPKEYENGCMASFIKINYDWGLKLYYEKQLAERAMMRHLYLLEKDLAPNMGYELFSFILPGWNGPREMFGYLNGMCDEAYDSPNKERDWPLMQERYIQAGLKELLWDVNSCGLNWGYRRTDGKPVVYDFMTWSAPKWLDELHHH